MNAFDTPKVDITKLPRGGHYKVALTVGGVLPFFVAGVCYNVAFLPILDGQGAQ